MHLIFPMDFLHFHDIMWYAYYRTLHLKHDNNIFSIKKSHYIVLLIHMYIIYFRVTVSKLLLRRQIWISFKLFWMKDPVTKWAVLGWVKTEGSFRCWVTATKLDSIRIHLSQELLPLIKIPVVLGLNLSKISLEGGSRKLMLLVNFYFYYL